jgi:sterol desaturase/sphingolipid hydroxylase (fatty acid hydroxylase superfamily)
MDVDPAIGKILGMVMAYAVSALGLLLAYYNYRKRVVKAERIFSARAWAVLSTIGVGVVLALVVAGAAAAPGYATRGEAIRAQLPGMIVPGAVFALSFWVTWKLYVKFSQRGRRDDEA